jgi:hypothetical protein
MTGSLADVSGKTEIATLPIPASDQELVVAMDTPETTLFAIGQETVQTVAVSEQEILDNDTIESLAYKAMGSVDEWGVLASLNGLEYPYIAKGLDAFSEVLGVGVFAGQIDRQILVNGLNPLPGQVIVVEDEWIVVEHYAGGVITAEEGFATEFPLGTKATLHERRLAVLLPGDKIKVPGAAQVPISIVPGGDDFASELYGVDEYLDGNGRQSASSDGSVATVAGIANLEMQLSHRLRTLRGELKQHPKYGSLLPLFIGKINIDLWLERALLEVELGVQADPRIERVTGVKFNIVNTAIYAETWAVPVGQLSPSRLSILVS